MEQPVGSAPVDTPTGPLPRGWWRFVLFGLLLAIALRWTPFALLPVQIDLGYFLPLLMGWLGLRYGRASFVLLLLLGILAIIRVDVQIVGWFSIALRVTAAQYLVGLVAAFALAIPDIDRWLAQYWRRWWHGAVWLVLTVLLSESVLFLYWTLKFGDWGQARVDFGLALVGVMVLASFRWRTVSEYRLRILRGKTAPGLWAAVVLFLVALVLLMSVVNWYSPRIGMSTIESLRLRTGIAYAPSWSFALCFALTAFALVDTRRLCLAMVLIFMLSVLCAWYWPPLGELRSYPQNLPLLVANDGWQGITGFFNTQVVVDDVCAALLGAILAPYVRSPAPASLRARSTPWMLGLILALQFVITPFILDDSFYADYLVLGGVAFVAGALWRDRALIAVPIFILVCHFVASAAINHDLRAGYVMSDMFLLGFTVFPFVLAGVLIHPHIVLVAPGPMHEAPR